MEPNKAYGNNQLISVVKAAYPILEANPSELAALMKNAALDQIEKIENAIEKDNGVSDLIVYGANLTFANLEEAKFYEFDYREEKPVYVRYRVDGVGDEGDILVFPGPLKNGRTIMAILPENESTSLASVPYNLYSIQKQNPEAMQQKPDPKKGQNPTGIFYSHDLDKDKACCVPRQRTQAGATRLPLTLYAENRYKNCRMLTTQRGPPEIPSILLDNFYEFYHFTYSY
ncbi:unnamed protein product [Fraxinus pennsylvanica]|uniref:Uncharacterized protein n=1 Tax=Fraxinus pennsylvanica TaxID=56036 RepID=A0AAD1Z4K5_9LAMI|nr:unnamed protein product [Fraxinus pennsylvanica]